jgi:uncharacterized phage-associated protein
MPVHPLTAAKRVCELRDWGASNLEINKILYLAHMLSLGRTEGARRLVTEHFEAWDYGPVLPSVYHRAKAFGKRPVQDVFRAFPYLRSGHEAEIIEEVMDSVRDKTPAQLVAITHWNKGAWAQHYRPGAQGIVIPDRDILAEYRKRAS